ncbi:MAG: phosphate ABC transporter substrate-binding protein PstS [Actinoplanes sp.]
MRIRHLALGGLLLLGACAAPQPVAAGPETIACAGGSVRAQGSSAQTNAVNNWIKNYQVQCPEATLEYASTGSGAGVRVFVDGTGDFAGSDSPLTPAERSGAEARCGGPAVHLPMVVGPIALVYTVAGAGDLRLRPATIGAIFAGAVTVWNDPAIAADNPGAPLPATRIRTVHRADSSGTTGNFTAFLAATAGGSWRFGAASTWPAPGGNAQRGSNRLATTVARSDGAIGYVEASYARFHNLATARVGNGAGEFAALTDEAAGRTVAGARSTGTGGDLPLRIDYATKEPEAYPIVLVTYEIVCRTGTPGLVRSFLAYTSSPAGQAAATRLGYAPLPEKLRAEVAAAVAGLA